MGINGLPETPEIYEAPTTSSGSNPSSTPMDLSTNYIAYCGIDCSRCPHYRNSCPEGCFGSTCANDCGLCAVRNCGLESRVINCAYCEQYPCQKMENQYAIMVNDGFSEWATAARATLEAVRANRGL